jgi:hypothetical protein
LEDVVEGLLRALVARGELTREGQEALDDRVAVYRVLLIEVAVEEPSIGPRSIEALEWELLCCGHEPPTLKRAANRTVRVGARLPGGRSRVA